MTTLRRSGFLVAFVLLLGGMCATPRPAHAQELSVVEPAEVGLSADRLERLTRVLERQVTEDLLPGAVVLVAREGKVAYLNAHGMQDREEGEPVRAHTIFRIASMTKPITSVAVMMLYEEGRFLLGDPISDYIPAFADVRVLADSVDSSRPVEERATVPAERPITIRDLLTHTSGLVYQWNPALGAAYADAGITHGLVGDEDTLAEDVRRLAELPLLHQPGERWTYGLSVDVLGRLVEVVSGMPLDEFFRARIFEPLGMEDTQFHVSPEQESRLAAAYTVGEDGGLQKLGSEPVQGDGATIYSAPYPTREEHRYLSGGGGLTSTVPDYFRFTQMLLNGGILDGARLLGPETVELMTSDHVGSLRENQGFGLGFGVTRSLAERGDLGGAGTYSWGSFWYGTFFVDPAEELIAISVANKHPGGGADLNAKLEVLVRQAVTDRPRSNE